MVLLKPFYDKNGEIDYDNTIAFVMLIRDFRDVDIPNMPELLLEFGITRDDKIIGEMKEAQEWLHNQFVGTPKINGNTVDILATKWKEFQSGYGSHRCHHCKNLKCKH
jgi:hypothetical protein